MKNKFNVKLFILTIINIAICLSLIIFKSPNKVPFLFNLKEEIILLLPKWILLVCVISPTLIFVLICIINKNKSLNFFLKMLFITALYENMLIMVYIAGTDTFSLNQISEIPISLFYIMPIPFFMMIGSIKLKYAPYKSFSPFKNKYSLEDEFVWKQSHIHSNKIMFPISFSLIILTIIFSFLRLLIVNIILILLSITIIYIFVIKETKQMSQKHAEMQAKKDRLNKK